MVTLVSKVHQGQLANLESLACQVQRVEMEDQGHLDLKDLRETKEILDQMDHQVHLEMMVSMEKEALLDPKVKKANQAFKADQVLGDPLELKDPKVILEHLVFLAILVNKVLVE